MHAYLIYTIIITLQATHSGMCTMYHHRYICLERQGLQLKLIRIRACSTNCGCCVVHPSPCTCACIPTGHVTA